MHVHKNLIAEKFADFAESKASCNELVAFFRVRFYSECLMDEN